MERRARGCSPRATLFRGLAIEQLTTLTGNRLLAAGITVTAFILVHMLRYDVAQLVSIGLVSILLTGLYLWRRDLVANIIAHAVLDGVGLVHGGASSACRGALGDIRVQAGSLVTEQTGDMGDTPYAGDRL